jgi:hypothetical protein
VKARFFQLLFVIALLFFSLASFAHDASLGVLEFREVRAGVYVGRWKIEPAVGAARVDLRMPPHCYLQLPELNCGEKGLVGAITIANLGANMSAALIKIMSLTGESKSFTITSANPVVTVLAAGAPSFQTWAELAQSYVNYGIDHILLGADHLLFVLGLIFIVGGGWRLVKTITAFTVGHSMSLAAAAFGWIGVAERPLNACIALSIVFLAVEMAKEKSGESGLTALYPWAVAGGFGLVHGIGFASALAGLGIERELLPAALAFFNVGVEIGQLGFVLLVLGLIWAHRQLGALIPSWGEQLPAYAIGSVSAFWFFGRLARILAAN